MRRLLIETNKTVNVMDSRLLSVHADISDMTMIQNSVLRRIFVQGFLPGELCSIYDIHYVKYENYAYTCWILHLFRDKQTNRLSRNTWCYRQRGLLRGCGPRLVP